MPDATPSSRLPGSTADTSPPSLLPQPTADAALALLTLRPTDGEAELRPALLALRDRVAPGRHLAVLWDLSPDWTTPDRPVEAWVLAAIPVRRAPATTADRFTFAGNVVVRGYGPDAAVPARTLAVLLLRRDGPPPHARARTALPELLARARLDTRAFAFTRDVANNVWHLPTPEPARDSARDPASEPAPAPAMAPTTQPATELEAAVLARLAALLAWPDEPVVARTPDGIALHPAPFAALVPVADKLPYPWAEDVLARHRTGRPSPRDDLLAPLDAPLPS